MNPQLSYTIWFSQRNGSSLLCEGLKSTGIAGKPEEHFNISNGGFLLNKFSVGNYKEFQNKLWQEGTTQNGVFAIKVNAPRKENDPIIEELKKLPIVNSSPSNSTNFDVWNAVFPNGKHIYLTRRNKVKQAVSWWKAIVTQEWHRKRNAQKPIPMDGLIDKYDFEAIKHLLTEISLRESKIQAFFEEGKVIPMTIVYEDFVKDFEGTIKNVIQFLGLTEMDYPVSQPFYEKLADEISDIWVDRFRKEIQKDWKNIIW